MSSDAFMSHLSSRLTTAEDCFLTGDIITADSSAVDILRDLVSLYSKGSRLLTSSQHTCVSSCVCQPAMILHLQCCFELGRTEEYIREKVVEAFYESSQAMPYDVFHVWIQLQLAHARYEYACKQLIQYLDTHYSTTSAELFIAYVTSPPAEVALANTRYLTLLSLLLFHCLVPLRAYDEAIDFLRKGKRKLGGNEREKDERIDSELRESWILELQRLKAAKFSTPVAATEEAERRAKLEAEGEDAAALMGDSSAQPSNDAFHAGLSSLAATTSYSRTTGSLPPALLPPAPTDHSMAATVQRASDDSIEDESAAGSGGSSSSSDSSSLIPYPPVLSLLPDPTSPSFSLTTYLESLSHRIYFLLWKRFPSLANRLRRSLAWVWERRPLIAAVMLAYVGWRVLKVMVAYFRLAELPGVAMLIAELKNFIKIAFISGTGRSLFG